MSADDVDRLDKIDLAAIAGATAFMEILELSAAIRHGEPFAARRVFTPDSRAALLGECDVIRVLAGAAVALAARVRSRTTCTPGAEVQR